MRAFVTINKIGCFSPAVALALLSLLVPFLGWADNARDVQDENNKDKRDYHAAGLQYPSDTQVHALGNEELAALAADIKSGDMSGKQRQVNQLWLRDGAVTDKKPLTGGKAAGRVARAAIKQAWQQFRASAEHTSKLLPDKDGGYNLAPRRSSTDYTLRLDGGGLKVDVEAGKASSYAIELDNDGASLEYQYRF